MGSSEHPKRRGQRSEAAVLYELVKRGIPVLEPFGDNERYDLVAEVGNEFHRIQVKTAREENGSLQFETRSSGTLTRAIDKESYEGDIDVFAVHAPAYEETFAVPIEVAPKTTMSLRIRSPTKSSPAINWADDYGLDDWLDSLRPE